MAETKKVDEYLRNILSYIKNIRLFINNFGSNFSQKNVLCNINSVNVTGNPKIK